MSYVMIYESTKNSYTIKPSHQVKGIDSRKIGEEVKKYNQNIWVGKTKEALKEQSQIHIEEQIQRHLKAIEKIQKRTLIEVKQKYNHA